MAPAHPDDNPTAGAHFLVLSATVAIVPITVIPSPTLIIPRRHRMGEIVPAHATLADSVEPDMLVAYKEPLLLSSPKSQRRPPKLAPLPTRSFTTQFGGISSSSPARHRAALTPAQAFHHASGSFFAPEAHVYDEWTHRTTDTIPEASYSGSSSGSGSSPDLAAVQTPAAVVGPIVHESRPSPSPVSVRPRSRPRSRSHASAGIHYSSAHRRVPSSPSFRSTTLPSYTYFDRPPSPSSSIGSRSSEPPMGVSLSLSELLSGFSRMSPSDSSYTPEEDRVRREEQREERRLAMLERHTTLIEQREKRRKAKLQ